MKTRTAPIWLALTTMMALTVAHANPVASNPILKLLTGDWTGEGELVDNDGHKQPVKETWTGKFTETGNFIMSGQRTLDQQTHQFAWEFYPNGELIEGQMKMSEPQIDLRFEVAIDETARSVTMKIPTTTTGSLMTIVNTVSADGKSLSGTVEIRDDAGKVTSTGKVAHQKP